MSEVNVCSCHDRPKDPPVSDRFSDEKPDVWLVIFLPIYSYKGHLLSLPPLPRYLLLKRLLSDFLTTMTVFLLLWKNIKLCKSEIGLQVRLILNIPVPTRWGPPFTWHTFIRIRKVVTWTPWRTYVEPLKNTRMRRRTDNFFFFFPDGKVYMTHVKCKKDHRLHLCGIH